MVLLKKDINSSNQSIPKMFTLILKQHNWAAQHASEVWQAFQCVHTVLLNERTSNNDYTLFAKATPYHIVSSNLPNISRAITSYTVSNPYLTIEDQKNHRNFVTHAWKRKSEGPHAKTLASSSYTSPLA